MVQQAGRPPRAVALCARARAEGGWEGCGFASGQLYYVRYYYDSLGGQRREMKQGAGMNPDTRISMGFLAVPGTPRLGVLVPRNHSVWSMLKNTQGPSTRCRSMTRFQCHGVRAIPRRDSLLPKVHTLGNQAQ